MDFAVEVAAVFLKRGGSAVFFAQRFSQRSVRWLGLLITTIAIAFVVWSLYSSKLLTTDAWTDTHVMMGVILTALIFTASLFFVFTAWHTIVMSVSEVRISWIDGLYIYAISQIYKYIPSNIMHHVGRYYLLRERGVEHSAAGWGILAETGLIIAASIVVALVFGAPLIRASILDVLQGSLIPLLAVVGAVFVVGCAAALFLRAKRTEVRALIDPFLRRQVLIAGLKALLLQVGGRILSGFALWWLASSLLDGNQPSMPDVTAIWSAAWLIGYLTPGASAGLGVREAVIIGAFMALGVSLEGATLVALAFRVATILGDLFFAGIGYVAHRIGMIPALQHDVGSSGD